MENEPENGPIVDTIVRTAVAKLERLQAAALKRAVTPAPETVKAESKPRSNRGRTGISIIEQSQLDLFRNEHAGRFERSILNPESEFPTFLTRLPIFVPARRSHQRELLDEENAMNFETSWGRGRKFGPPLTVYDEDTLIAIGKLRQNRLKGRGHNMPIPITEVHRLNDNNVSVHLVHCMITDLQHVCNQSCGGRNIKMRMDSVRRLASTVIEVSPESHNKFIKSGTSFKLIDVAWQEFHENAVLLIQFHPVMAAWYENEYTYLDFGLRQKLPDTGKALHRFWSSQPKHYEIGTLKLLRTIGYMREHKKFMVDLRSVLKQLEAEQWLSEYRIEGNGRTKPFKVVTSRT